MTYEDPSTLPLTWEYLTKASRLMLPIYVLMFGGVAANWMVTPESRLVQTPGLAFASGYISLRAVGAVFAVVSLMVLAALILKHRLTCVYALYLGAITMSLWAVMMLIAVFVSSTTPSGWTWPGFIAAACIASARSVLHGERQ